jgi:hypothetical protein
VILNPINGWMHCGIYQTSDNRVFDWLVQVGYKPSHAFELYEIMMVESNGKK